MQSGSRHHHRRAGRGRPVGAGRRRAGPGGPALIVLGAWGALVPFIGPYLDYSWGSDETWLWTAGRWWLEVLPGLVTVGGGWLVFASGNRIGSWLAAAAGGWFVIGQSLSAVWHLGSVGTPLSLREGGQAAAQLGYFYGVGVLVLLLAARHLGDARPNLPPQQHQPLPAGHPDV